MIYEVKILSGAIKQLEVLPLRDYKALKSKITSLSKNPR
jgi:mRNA-degrading endonuclease RelE of RelBE toxin-antitoxin system